MRFMRRGTRGLSRNKISGKLAATAVIALVATSFGGTALAASDMSSTADEYVGPAVSETADPGTEDLIAAPEPAEVPAEPVEQEAAVGEEAAETVPPSLGEEEAPGIEAPAPAEKEAAATSAPASVESLVFDPAVVTIPAGELATGHLVGKIADWDSATQKVMVGLKLGSNVVGEPVEATVDADGNFTVDFSGLGLTGGRYNANSPLYVATAEVVSLSSDEVLTSGTASLRVLRAPAEVVSVEMTPADPECVADYPVTISGVVKGFASAVAPDNNNSIRIRVLAPSGGILNQVILTSVDADGAFSYQLPLSSVGGQYRVTVEFRGAWAEGTENQEYTLNIAETCPSTDIEVTPVAPRLIPSLECGVDSAVAIPYVKGVKYTQVRDGTTLKITATAEEGYVIAPNALVAWSFEVGAEPCDAVAAG